MARILVTGSTEGLGRLAGEALLAQGHAVILHARTEAKASALRAALPQADVVTGDLETLAGMRAVAGAGAVDAVIHNAGVGDSAAARLTPEGVPAVFAVNVLAPYVLSALMPRPARVVVIGSGMHRGAAPRDLAGFWRQGTWAGRIGYSQTKFLAQLFAMALARAWPEARVNTVDPGWVPTRMGGPSAPDDLTAGAETQAWLAAGEDPGTLVTGQHFRHCRTIAADPGLQDQARQAALLTLCAQVSGLRLPAA